MIITISAAQGQGKTTFIQDVLQYSSHKDMISSYPYKSARKIIKDMGKSLEEIYDSRDMLVSFQEEILKIHSQILTFKYDSKILLVERSFIDIMAFTVINLGRFNSLNKWINSFVNICNNYQKSVHYSVYIKKNIKPKDDFIRPININYNNLYDVYMCSLLKNYDNIIYINKPNRIDRVNEFDEYLSKNLKEKL